MRAANDNQPKRYGPWLPTKGMARERGAKTYFNGIVCVRGHIAPRATSSSNCIACLYEDGMKFRNSPETAEKARTYMREYRARRSKEDPEFKEREREAGRRHDAKPERRAKRNARKRWRIANDDEFRIRINENSREAKRQWKRDNPEAVRAIGRTRRARLRGSEGHHTAADIEAIHRRQKFKCAECGKSTKAERHVDHIMPIALGGTNWHWNLQILCPFCNDSKGAKHPADFAKSRGRLI